MFGKHIYTYVYGCNHAYMYIYIHIYECTYIRIHISIHMQTKMCWFVYVRVHAYVRTHPTSISISTILLFFKSDSRGKMLCLLKAELVANLSERQRETLFLVI